MQTKSTLDDILERLRTAQAELEQELENLLAQNRENFHYQLNRGKVVFEEGIRRLQHQQRTGLWRYLSRAPIGYMLSAPIIYGMIFPLVILDLSVTIYQQVCFRVYCIPRVNRSRYLVIDRHHLGYLNGIEKLNCFYCSYANGLMSYAREIAARTEQFWCPIKHAQKIHDPHHRESRFFDYGDDEAWRHGFKRLRRDWHKDT